MDWLDLLAVQGTLKSLLQHHSSKAPILQCSAFFIVQLSHPSMTTRKTLALTRWTFVGKVMSLLFTTLSRLIITFLPRSKCLCCSNYVQLFRRIGIYSHLPFIGQRLQNARLCMQGRPNQMHAFMEWINAVTHIMWSNVGELLSTVNKWHMYTKLTQMVRELGRKH